MGAGKTWRRRFGCALALVLAPLLALALGQPMGEAMLPGAPGSLSPTSVCARRGCSQLVRRGSGCVDGREELRANDDWSVVSFVEEGDGLPIASLASWRDAGWALVASGQEGVWTGVKEGGRCSWLALSCTWVGDVLCVVLQVNAPMG